MSHLPFTLLAYFFNALSVLTSKFLLNKAIPDPFIYVFYISLISFLAVLALPFTSIPSPSVFILASLSTMLWTLGAYLMFKALKIGDVSRTIPIIGTLIPLILLIFASETNAISKIQVWAVLILTLGIILLTLNDIFQRNLKKEELFFAVLSALSFAFSYFVLRQTYLNLDFFSVLVWSRLILLPFTLIVLLIPGWRKKIMASFSSLSHGRSNTGINTKGLLFLGGQISGAASEFLLLFSISLADPALVNSLQGIQYVFLLIFALILSRKYPTVFEEKYTFVSLLWKMAGIGLIGTGLYLLTV